MVGEGRDYGLLDAQMKALFSRGFLYEEVFVFGGQGEEGAWVVGREHRDVIVRKCFMCSTRVSQVPSFCVALDSPANGNRRTGGR